MNDRYISVCYIKEKWENLESDINALIRCANEKGQIPVKDADRMKNEIEFYIGAIEKELFGDL